MEEHSMWPFVTGFFHLGYILSSGFIHVVVCVKISFLFKAEQHCTVWIEHILLPIRPLMGIWVVWPYFGHYE